MLIVRSVAPQDASAGILCEVEFTSISSGSPCRKDVLKASWSVWSLSGGVEACFICFICENFELFAQTLFEQLILHAYLQLRHINSITRFESIQYQESFSPLDYQYLYF